MGRGGRLGHVVGPRVLLPVAALVLAAGCSAESNPANDFCHSYGDAVHTVVAAARQYSSNPDNFPTAYKSTMDSLGAVRAKAPDSTLRSAFDRAMFTFTVFDNDADLAGFLSRADFSTNAVVLACADYGVNVTV
jgi:hypothetical protein